jgi:hypothetical protein
MPSAIFEHTISAGERSQTYALDRAATGTGFQLLLVHNNRINSPSIKKKSNYLPASVGLFLVIVQTEAEGLKTHILSYRKQLSFTDLESVNGVLLYLLFRPCVSNTDVRCMMTAFFPSRCFIYHERNIRLADIISSLPKCHFLQ